MKDALGDRIKSQYEDRTRISLPRRTYTIVRVDGKAFHTFTKGCKKPYDYDLMNIMDCTAAFMCENIQGVHLAYTQSDEISLLLTDFAKPTSAAWFDGNLQKMASVAASIATVGFNKELLRTKLVGQSYGGTHQIMEDLKLAMFDARVFTIPDPVEVENYFIWRQTDATRNSIQMAAHAVYSHKELDGKNTSDLQDMLMDKGVNWNDYTSGEKRGRAIIKQSYTAVGKDKEGNETNFVRNRWVSYDGRGCDKFKYETPIFTQDRGFLRRLIPRISEVNFGLDGAK